MRVDLPLSQYLCSVTNRTGGGHQTRNIIGGEEIELGTYIAPVRIVRTERLGPL